MKNLLQFKPKQAQSNIPTSRECTRCGEIKNLNEFHDKKGGKYNKNSRCIPCISIINKNRSKKNSQTAAQSASVIALASKSKKKLEQNATLKSKLVSDSIFVPEIINEILSESGDSRLKRFVLDLLRSVLGSSTGYNIKEQYVANVLDLFHCTDVNGPDAYSKINPNEAWEIKTNFVAMDGSTKIKAGGSFNDITAKKLLEIPKYTMAVGIFVDHTLVAIGTFPGNWPPFIDKLHEDFAKGKKKEGRVCASFHYNHWKDCPDAEWAVLPDVKSLYNIRDKMTQQLFDDLATACTNAMKSTKPVKTSSDKEVNIQGL